MTVKLSWFIALLTVVSVGFLGQNLCSQAPNKGSAPPARKGDVAPKDTPTDDAPPEIKKGVRIILSINQRSPFNPAKFGEGFMVEEINGSWVRMKGEPFEGFPGNQKEISVWINFRLVEWFQVKQQ